MTATRYTPADLISLLWNLLAPVVKPLLDEVRAYRAWRSGGRAATPAAPVPVALPLPAAPVLVPAVEPAPTPVAVVVPAAVGVEPTAFLAKVAAERTPAPVAAGVLFVKRGEGKGTRYTLAGPEAVGQRFRRLAGKGGRAKYEPVL